MQTPSDAPEPHADPSASGRRLILVATPIGNLGDLPPRAAEALRSADLIAAEDTRRTRVLLDHIGAATPMTSYHEHNEAQRTAPLLDRVAAGETIVLVSDAGMPGIADPGYRLVQQAIARGLPVEAIPGPNAAIQALVLSGLPLDRFTFEGFLPRKGGARSRRLSDLAAEARTMIFYVAPHRAGEDLAAMADAFGGRPAALARELTKVHEEVLRATLPELLEIAEQRGIRGEVTVVVAGAPQRQAPDVADLVDDVDRLVSAGTSRKDAVADVARAHGVARRALYQAVLQHASDTSG
ncbi:MAG: 16S rRNA (cytidine(1402)-2'-O)-methyltransferase [Nitriliruptorales bacterium]|nr:16S rRNA (cytidine(1402)-2'-O)-methyltransferase [Nitriliruptorales bacterium]